MWHKEGQLPLVSKEGRAILVEALFDILFWNPVRIFVTLSKLWSVVVETCRSEVFMVVLLLVGIVILSNGMMISDEPINWFFWGSNLVWFNDSGDIIWLNEAKICQEYFFNIIYLLINSYYAC